MEVLATMKAYRKADGAYLGRAEMTVFCDCCEDFGEFEEKHTRDIAECLQGALMREINVSGVLFALHLVELEEVPDGEDEQPENDMDGADNYDEFVKTSVRWLD